MGNQKRPKRGEKRRSERPVSIPGQRPAPAPRKPSPFRTEPKAATAAIVSTVLLFALMALGLWVGDAIYTRLPFGPLPQNRVVSAILSIAVMLAILLILLRAFSIYQVRRRRTPPSQRRP